MTNQPLHPRACHPPPVPKPKNEPFTLKIAAVAQLQGARCDGMAHAISSIVQRRRWVADAVFRFTHVTQTGSCPLVSLAGVALPANNHSPHQHSWPRWPRP